MNHCMDDCPKCGLYQNCSCTWLDILRALRESKAEIKQLRKHAEAEYQRGLEEGSSCQAILEIQGRERFMKEAREEFEAKAAGGE